jgi:hypothetical protein
MDFGDRAGCDARDLDRHTDLFGTRFKRWFQEKATELNLPATSWNHPRVIGLTWGVQWDWPVYRDGPEFVATYGGILKFRREILDLGRKTADAMRHLASTIPQADSKEGTRRYAGFHLRSESDALSEWPKFDEQSSTYLREASDRKFKAAYLATGNATEASRLAERARDQHQVTVVTKHELLQSYPGDLQVLEALTWDQQALVDFLVLLDSDFFFGVSPSSFSINIAGKRHLQMDGLYTRPWKVGLEGDGRSLLIGKYDNYWANWLFMYDSLWP